MAIRLTVNFVPSGPSLNTVKCCSAQEKMNWEINIFFICFLLTTFSGTADGRNNRVTIIRMVTTTTINTSTRTTGTVCFKITSNPGDPPVTSCRKRRQFWIEDPIFFSAPEEQQLLAQFHIQPTEILQVKPTAVPGFKSSFQHPELDDNYDSGSLINLAPSQSLESSFYLSESDLDYDHRVYYPPPPLFLRRVWNYVSDDMYRWFGNLGTSSTTRRTRSTVTFTRIKTLTENEVTTKTNTIAISGCTISPLPFDICI
ncbi:uncharacterized protein LOC124326456 [Daphnia pulicaria]|uniref:uncharacterized protein LOC124326456 n=1 Tax=Daphnia pulicaria TaxID=35523 RepID=UPI001EE9B53F|nr:uncharacterized protein LOC124326456 [Daphnia pulicaria]